MTKSNITVSVETEIIEEARKRGINISEAAELGIAGAVNWGHPKDKDGFKTRVFEIEKELERPFKIAFVLNYNKFGGKRTWRKKISEFLDRNITKEETGALFVLLSHDKKLMVEAKQHESKQTKLKKHWGI